MKTKTLLIAAAMFLALSAVAFSQQVAVYSVSSTPITTVIATGNAEPAGDITFTQTSGTTVNNPTGNFSIQYGGNNVNITSVFSNSLISNCTGGYAGNCPTVLTSSSIYSPGLLVISVPPGVVSGSFTVTGVRVQISGAGLTNLIANISATGNQLAAGSTNVTVINSTTGAGLAPGSVASYNSSGLVSPYVPIVDLSKQTGYTVINAVNGTLVAPTQSVTVIKVGEGFLGAWSKNVGVRIRVSATPPKGVTFAFPQTATSFDAASTASVNSWVRGGSTSSTAATSGTTINSDSTSASLLSVYYYVATDVGSTTVEALEIPVTVSVGSSANFPLPASVFTYTVTLAPVLGPYNTSGSNSGKPDGLPAPRFTELLEGPGTLAAIQGSSTTLLIPYGYASKTAGDFNTAMAIANTTEDPGLANLGFTGATPNAGPVTFYLFPMDTTLPMFTYKTVAGSPGSGLDASGNVASGGTYSVFLSQIFPLATPPTGSTATLGNVFQGYVMIVTGFTNGHGIFVISNFTTLTAQSSLMMVLGNRTAFPEVVNF